MANNTYFKGTEIKFSINLSAPDFSMDDDDFDIEVKTGNVSVKGYKGVQDEDLGIVIFKEGEDWFAIVDTKKLSSGRMTVIGTAHIVDANAADGVRDDIATATLGQLQYL